MVPSRPHPMCPHHVLSGNPQRDLFLLLGSCISCQDFWLRVKLNKRSLGSSSAGQTRNNLSETNDSRAVGCGVCRHLGECAKTGNHCGPPRIWRFYGHQDSLFLLSSAPVWLPLELQNTISPKQTSAQDSVGGAPLHSLRYEEQFQPYPTLPRSFTALIQGPFHQGELRTPVVFLLPTALRFQGSAPETLGMARSVKASRQGLGPKPGLCKVSFSQGTPEWDVAFSAHSPAAHKQLNQCHRVSG